MTDYEKSIMDKIDFFKDPHFLIGGHYVINLADSFLKKICLILCLAVFIIHFSSG